METTSTAVRTIPSRNGKNFANKKFYNHDFSNQDLAHADFRCATLVECNFGNSDLSFANFEGANCWGADFTDSKLYKTNFKDAVLSNSKMFPRDFFGVTITIHCDTMSNMRISEKWYNVWLYLATLMKPPNPEMETRLVKLIGPELYVKLREIFDSRTL